MLQNWLLVHSHRDKLRFRYLEFDRVETKPPTLSDLLETFVHESGSGFT